MSNIISALNGQTQDGITELGLRGMITLRGDLSSQTLQKACRDVTGQDVPDTRRASVEGDTGLAWMSPDELLVMVPHVDALSSVETLNTILAGEHHMAVNVSDARAVFRVDPSLSRDVLARLSPVDFHVDSFGPGDFRRTRIAQVAAAFWMEPDGAIHVICFRSVAAYVFGLLTNAAKSGPSGLFKSA